MNEVPIPERLRWQADWCVRLGSPLYGELLERAAGDFERGGPCAQLLAGHEDDPLGSALPLRFLGAVHRLVLSGRAPELAAFYPSTGGSRSDDDECWAAFVATLESQAEALPELIDRPVQTNEVARAGALLGGFLLIGRETGLPLRLLEVGASAGLNLRFDRYRYDWGGAVFGDPASPVRFEQLFAEGSPPDTAIPQVADRRGCDRSPLDAASDEDRLTLLSYVWPDQDGRIERLRAALEIGARVPAQIENADAGEWAAAALSEPEPGSATVLFHSIVLAYLSEESWAQLESAIHGAGARATPDAPFAWLWMEPADELADVRLKLWPGGEERLIARAGYQGATGPLAGLSEGLPTPDSRLVRRLIREPLAQRAERAPERLLRVLVVERRVDVGRVQRVDRRRQGLNRTGPRLDAGRKRQVEFVQRGERPLSHHDDDPR